MVGRVIIAKTSTNLFLIIFELLHHNFAQRPRPIFSGLDLAKFFRKKNFYILGVGFFFPNVPLSTPYCPLHDRTSLPTLLQIIFKLILSYF